jgi:hypothetical protein
MTTDSTNEPPVIRRPRALVLYYSQSGEVRQVAEAFTAPLGPVLHTEWRELRPRTPYPSPWRSLRRFFDVMPETVLGLPPEIEPLELSAEDRFDLVVLAYQVWYLAPSLPVQALFQSPAAAVLHGTPVITLSVSRNMWQRASLRMKRLLHDAAALHLDHIVVTHQGPPLATFVTTTRALLWGRRDRFLGIFPPAGVAAAQLERVRALGELAASRVDHLQAQPPTSLLAGDNSVPVLGRFIVPEILAERYFALWARLIRLAGKLSSGVRGAAVLLFALSLAMIVVLGLPLALLGHLLISPWVQPWLRSYTAELKRPGGS